MDGEKQREEQKQPGDDLMEGKGIGKPMVYVDQDLDQEELKGEESKETVRARILKEGPRKRKDSRGSESK
jgi:hypothetical protein